MPLEIFVTFNISEKCCSKMMRPSGFMIKTTELLGSSTPAISILSEVGFGKI